MIDIWKKLLSRSGFASIAPHSALSLHQKGRQLNVVDFNNEFFSETFSLHAEKHTLLQNLSDYTFELKDCCKKCIQNFQKISII